MTVGTEYRVRVTARHIKEGLAGDCHRCAVALALNEATGDKESMVAESDWTLRLKVWSRWIAAPYEVRRFVYDLDGLDRTEDGRPKLPKKLSGTDTAPFAFTLPPMSDPEWQEECYRCEVLFDPGELDDEGYCEECRKAEEGR